jgi:hypothetical protein
MGGAFPGREKRSLGRLSCHLVLVFLGMIAGKERGCREMPSGRHVQDGKIDTDEQL